MAVLYLAIDLPDDTSAAVKFIPKVSLMREHPSGLVEREVPVQTRGLHEKDMLAFTQALAESGRLHAATYLDPQGRQIAPAQLRWVRFSPATIFELAAAAESAPKPEPSRIVLLS
jgi:hypothetical protein